MTKTCRQCATIFEITKRDLEFYQKMDVPPPTLCYFCRMLRRLAYRNERHLYHRTCDLTGKQIISAFSKESAQNRALPKFPVYDIDEWWTDKWDPKSFGRDYDFSRPFFEQFFELQSVVPRLALQQQRPMENSAYCNAASQNKNCYLVFSTNHCEDCYYGSWINYSRNCIDNLNILNSELCYDCVYIRNCYHCFFAQESENCRDSYFIKNCVGSRDCFMSVNLVRKQYYMFNQPYSKEEYFKKLKTYNLGSRTVVNQLKVEFQRMCETSIVKYYVGTANERSTGNYLNHNKNSDTCFELDNSEDAAYCMNLNVATDVMDYSYWGEHAERVYECQACGYNLFNLKFCNLCWTNCSDLSYCDHCFSCKNCFGCVGLKNASYCILNKQYTKEAYEALVPRIIEHMKSTSEYGEFFPITQSPFAYNETLAFEQQPFSKEAVLSKGWQWIDRSQEYQYQGPAIEIADDIQDISDEIIEKILTCRVSGRHYKIIPQELKFYKEQGLPVPDRSPDQRHFDRLKLRNPRKLWPRTCQCQNATHEWHVNEPCPHNFQTTYAPERKEIVYCEECYVKEVY